MSKVCELCGSDRAVTRLGWFREQGVRAIDRCQDEDACRVRMESDGEEWPLLSRTELDRRSRETVL